MDGQLQEMIIEFSYNSGNDERKAVALLFQEEARKAGIKVDVVQQEWAKYLENQKNHRFEMYYGSWIGTPLPNDHKQIYHSSSYDGGSNYVGLANPQIDALIDSMRVELNDDRQAVMSKKFQELLHDECSYIFLFAPKERIAIHKRFTNALVSPMRPGYWEPSFSVSDKN
jgi:peptide/nickel transport system substrate-binding protein